MKPKDLRWWDKRVWSEFLNQAIQYITFIAIAAVVTLFTMFLFQFFQCVNHCGLEHALRGEYHTVNALCILLPLLVAAIVLKKTYDIQTIDSLVKLRTMLSSEKKAAIHKELIKERLGDNELDVEVLDYIGTIELGAIMHRKGLISDQELYNQFGYRVENIVNSSLFAKIEDDKLYYKDFFYIKDVVEKIGNKK